MKSRKQNPATGQGRGAGNIVALAGSYDTHADTTFNSEALAVAKIARRFGLPFPTARTVAELAGIGGVP